MMGVFKASRENVDALRKRIANETSELTDYRHLCFLHEKLTGGQPGEAFKYAMAHSFSKKIIRELEKTLINTVEEMLAEFIEQNPQFAEVVEVEATEAEDGPASSSTTPGQGGE